jgi:hypothetical protein
LKTEPFLAPNEVVRLVIMTEETIFAELIKDLDPFDRKLLFVLDELRIKQGSISIITSRFELCRSLRLQYNESNARKLDQSLERLEQTPLYLPDPSGFAIATRAVSGLYQEENSEKLNISLGKLFNL